MLLPPGTIRSNSYVSFLLMYLQFQLQLSDYFKVYTIGAKVAELQLKRQHSSLAGWIIMERSVKSLTRPKQVLAKIVLVNLLSFHTLLWVSCISLISRKLFSLQSCRVRVQSLQLRLAQQSTARRIDLKRRLFRPATLLLMGENIAFLSGQGLKLWWEILS